MFVLSKTSIKINDTNPTKDESSTLDWIAHIYDMVMYIKGVSPHTKSFEWAEKNQTQRACISFWGAYSPCHCLASWRIQRSYGMFMPLADTTMSLGPFHIVCYSPTKPLLYLLHFAQFSFPDVVFLLLALVIIFLAPDLWRLFLVPAEDSWASTMHTPRLDLLASIQIQYWLLPRPTILFILFYHFYSYCYLKFQKPNWKQYLAPRVLPEAGACWSQVY